MSLPSSITLTDLLPGYPVYEIQHAAVKARVALHGAHLMEWQPAGQEPVLYLSPQAVYAADKPIRGGVPVCWPWFGPPADASLPMHGFVRTRFWQLAEAEESATGVRLVFTIESDDSTRALWPHDFQLSLEMNLGAELSLALTMKNTGDTACEITDALHTYLSVQDVTQITVEGLDGKEYLDRLTHEPVIQEGDIVIDREVDRDYVTSEEIRVKDASFGRTLSVTTSGSGSAVVWNPWIKKAISLADMPDEDYKVFVCVETTNAWKDVINLAPRESHCLKAIVRVS